MKEEHQFNTFQPRQELQLKIFPVDTSVVVVDDERIERVVVETYS